MSINCICQAKNKSVCESTIGSLADGIQHVPMVLYQKTNGFKASHRVSQLDARAKRRKQTVHILKTNGFKASHRVSQLDTRAKQRKQKVHVLKTNGFKHLRRQT